MLGNRRLVAQELERYSLVCVPGQQPDWILPSERPVLPAISDDGSAWSKRIFSGQAAFIILHGRRYGEPGQRVVVFAVVPRHPLRRVLLARPGRTWRTLPAAAFVSRLESPVPDN